MADSRRSSSSGVEHPRARRRVHARARARAIGNRKTKPHRPQSCAGNPRRVFAGPGKEDWRWTRTVPPSSVLHISIRHQRRTRACHVLTSFQNYSFAETRVAVFVSVQQPGCERAPRFLFWSEKT